MALNKCKKIEQIKARPTCGVRMSFPHKAKPETREHTSGGGAGRSLEMSLWGSPGVSTRLTHFALNRFHSHCEL